MNEFDDDAKEYKLTRYKYKDTPKFHSEGLSSILSILFNELKGEEQNSKNSVVNLYTRKTIQIHLHMLKPCIDICAFVYAHILTYMFRKIYVQNYIYIHMYKFKCVYPYIHTYIHVHIK